MNLPNWRYPVVCDTSTGSIDFDSFEGRWCKQEALNRFLQGYPATEPPDYLQSVAPEVYEAECRRVRERFDEAVQIAESTFAEELSQLVSHLANRLGGEDDGKPKVFRDTAITNLLEFFERFERLNINSDEQLVARARGLLGGVRPEELREQESLRQRIASGLRKLYG